jgi:NhaP-type Na+/H+ or K+/H+ antiporter
MFITTYPAFELLRNGDWSYFEPERYDLWLLVAALVVMAAAMLPRLLDGRLITAPIVYLLIGAVLHFVLPFGEQPDLIEEIWWVKRLSELVVIVALTSAGLKLNSPFSKRTWRFSKRLLIIAMPTTMLVTFALGYWGFGFALATAVLLAAVIAPTDPVLASDIQTSPPEGEDSSPTRLALTTEAGVNDGLAFPFTYLAIGIAVYGGSNWEWIWSWFVMDFVYKIAAGILIGWGAGWLLNKAILMYPGKARAAKLGTGILSLSLTLLPYGVAELCGAYGFVSVFVAACVFRNLESQHEYQKQLHDFSEEIERTLVAVIFVLLGIYASGDLLVDLTWPYVIFSLLLIFAVRPLAGAISLIGTSLNPIQKFTMSFFGIRGIGSLYYLSYALYAYEFEQGAEAFALVVFLMILSAVVHGIAATPVVKRLEKAE